MGLPAIISRATKTLSKNSSHILTGFGIAGIFATAVLAVKATPKALLLIEEEEAITKKEIISTCWMLYLPAALTGVVSAACIIGAHSIDLRRTAAFASLYSIAEKALTEYQHKVIETIGENKERKVRDEIDKERVIFSDSNDIEIAERCKGDVLCFDSFAGRQFYSDIEKIKQAIEKLNRTLRSDGFISLNELYYELGLEGSDLGNLMGWDVDRGYIDVSYSSQLMPDGTPCLVMNLRTYPRYSE